MRSPEGWLLVPSTLPSLELGTEDPGRLVRAEGIGAAGPIVVPAGRTVTLLFDRGEIVNAYPRVTVSGGRDAVVRLTYAEALYDAHGEKGRRDDISGKTILGMFDEFVAGGEEARTFEPLWFRSWRYLELRITPALSPLRIDRLEAARTGFPFISGDDTALALARFGDHRRQRFRRAREDRFAFARDPIEEPGAGRHPVLDHFVQAGPEFAARQGAEHGGIDDDRVRLVKRSDHVLAGRMVDPGLAANRRVDLG